MSLSLKDLNGKYLVRCALIAISCDLPAGRKVCGLLGHGACLDCSRCLKKFTGTIGSMDYSGFDRENWANRRREIHMEKALHTLTAKTPAERSKLESSAGCRYSILLELPYFDPIQMLLIDPMSMHNLFLGTSKHFFRVIILPKLNNVKSNEIQKKINSFLLPPDMGRLSKYIDSSFTSFTADQWKNWTAYYSLPCLKEILNIEELECWRHFVLGCRVLLSNTLSLSNIKLGDALLLQFCRRVQSIFGEAIITPNMHLHCHLRQCMEDYGPFHTFWLFSFETYNGMLGSTPCNNKSIENQIMKCYLRDVNTLSTELPTNFSDEFSSLFSSGLIVRANELSYPVDVKSHCGNKNFWFKFSPEHGIRVPSYGVKSTLISANLSILTQLHSKLYGVSISNITELSSLCIKYSHVNMFGKLLGSQNCRFSSSSIVMYHGAMK